MDFDSIISSTRQYNFHSHTQFCDGRATMEVMARSAVEQGMRHYGFSPHSPIPFESPCNMSADDVPAYIAEVERLRKLPELASCRFYAAMEVDYTGSDWGPSSPCFASLPLDYIIGSVHFIPTQDGEPVDIDGAFENFKRRMTDRFRGDIDYVVDTFFSQTRDMIEAGGFDILGHVDKVGHNASDYAPGIEDGQHYRGWMRTILDLIESKNLVIELNTKAYAQCGRFFPGERYLPELVASGVRILVNSDAHYPERITASRAEAFRILDRLRHEN